MLRARPTAEVSATTEIDLRLPITGQVYAQLKRAILTLQFQPGEALSEKELSVKLGVSRTPVREALIKLSEEGLVDILPQRGSFVAPIRVAEVTEAQFIREALEVAVVRRAAEQCTDGLARRLDANLHRQRDAIVSQEQETFLRLDEEFHYTLSDGVMLPRAWKVIQNVKGQLDRVRFLSLPEPGHLEVLQAQHAAIVATVKAHDPNLAAEHMRTHLQEVFHSVRLLMREHPALFV